MLIRKVQQEEKQQTKLCDLRLWDLFRIGNCSDVFVCLGYLAEVDGCCTTLNIDRDEVNPLSRNSVVKKIGSVVAIEAAMLTG